MRGKNNRMAIVVGTMFAILALACLALPTAQAFFPASYGTTPNPPPPPLPPVTPPVVPPINHAPEPATLVTALVGSGILGFFAWRRRQHTRQE
jgi:hypothetical protein